MVHASAHVLPDILQMLHLDSASYVILAVPNALTLLIAQVVKLDISFSLISPA